MADQKDGTGKIIAAMKELDEPLEKLRKKIEEGEAVFDLIAQVVWLVKDKNASARFEDIWDYLKGNVGTKLEVAFLEAFKGAGFDEDDAIIMTASIMASIFGSFGESSGAFAGADDDGVSDYEEEDKGTEGTNQP